MLENGRISTNQFYMASILVVIGTTILFIPGLSITFGGRDAWMAPFLASIPGAISMLVMIQLNKYFPEQTPIEYLRSLFGKWLGSVLGAYLLWVLLRYFATMIREAADFTITAALQRTPPETVTILMLAAVFYVVRQGLEVILRLIQYVVIIELVQIVASVIVLASKDIDLGHFTPLFEDGIAPLLRSSLLLTCWFGELFVVGFLLPFIRNKHGTVKAGLGSIITIVLLLFVSIFFTLGVFGDVLASRMMYGLYEVARYISIAEFLERLDPIVMGTWIMFMYCKLTIFCYVISLGLAQLLRLTDYRLMVTVVCVIAFTMSEQIFVNQADMTEYFSTVVPLFAPLVELIVPLLILCFAALRKKWRGQRA